MRTKGWTMAIAIMLAGCPSDGDDDTGADPSTSDPSSTDDAPGTSTTETTLSTSDPDSGSGSTASSSATTGTDDDTSDDATTTGVDPDQDPLEGMGRIEQISSGYTYSEGPLWDPARGQLRFTDITGDTIYVYTPGGGTEVLRPPTDPGSFANGLAWDLDGVMLVCEHAQRVTKGDMAEETIASQYMGQPLNSPNDIVVHPNGTRFFTDPTLGSLPQFGGVTPVLGFTGVYRISATGDLTLIDDSPVTPNGIALSPDATRLYVTDTDLGIATAYELDGGAEVVGGPTVVYDQIPTADGMCMDVNGNLYLSSALGLVVVRPDGTSWGTIDFGDRPSNCAFGGDDLRTLFATVQDAVYRVDLAVPGLPLVGA